MTSPVQQAAQHPHYPAHTPQSRGGQFMPTHGGAGGAAAWAQAASSAIAGQRGLPAAPQYVYKKHVGTSYFGGVYTAYGVYDANGTHLGTVHSDLYGSWHANPGPLAGGPNATVGTINAGPSYSTRAAAAQALGTLASPAAAPSVPPAVATLAPAPPAAPAAPKVRFAGAGGGAYHVYTGTLRHGIVAKNAYGYWRGDTGPTPGSGQQTRLYPTRAAAAKALIAMPVSPAAPAAPPPPPTPPSPPPPPVPAAPSVPAPVVSSQRVPAPNTKKGYKLQYYVDHQGQTLGPFSSKAVADKRATLLAAPPHPVAGGSDLIGLPPRQRPNPIAAKVVGLRPVGSTRTGAGYSGVTVGSGAHGSVRAADDDLRTIADLQGFSGVPRLATKAQVDALVSGGSHYQLWRGVSRSGATSHGHAGRVKGKTAAQIQSEFRTGGAYYGVGVYGNGYYFSDLRSTATGYSDRSAGSVQRIVLPKNAKIGDYDTLNNEVSRLIAHHKASADTKDVFADVGRYAAARGYDVIRKKLSSYGSETYYIILNRSIVVAQQ